MSNELIAHIDELAANAWPPLINQGLGGWRLRYANGISQRANSALPNAMYGPTTLEERLVAVEEFYAQRGLPARYQLCPALQPPELDTVLAARGYRRIADTFVQTAPLERLLQPKERAAEVTISSALHDGWLDAYLLADSARADQREGRAAIFKQIGPRTAYAGIDIDGILAAVGLGVAERGWLGLFCMATLPTFRRRGAARTIIAALGHWGEQGGAQHAYLQVSADNIVAQALYAGIGFTTLYEYHYRERVTIY
jgi:ribosomal protein S18 acetylase RimI-like enzyme